LLLAVITDRGEQPRFARHVSTNGKRATKSYFEGVAIAEAIRGRF
jgi:hypothetical protein